MILIIIKFGELLLWISLRIIDTLRSYFKHSKKNFIRYPNTSKLVEKTLLRLVFSTHFSVDDNIRICFWNAERIWMNVIIGLEWKWMNVIMAFSVMMTFIHCLSAFQIKNLNHHYLFSHLRAYALIICFLVGRPAGHPRGIAFRDKQKPFKAPG